MDYDFGFRSGLRLVRSSEFTGLKLELMMLGWVNNVWSLGIRLSGLSQLRLLQPQIYQAPFCHSG